MPTNTPPDLPVQVVIEVPRGSFVKHDAHGHIDLLSPIPAPFNYGRVEGLVGGDGEPQDAVVLGPRLARGTRVKLQVQGVVCFVDGGERDDKWICAVTPPSRRQRLTVVGFFRLYAQLKRVRDLLSKKQSSSAFMGWHPAPNTAGT